MLTENKFGKYLLYAIGEIILVVIGILIALQINISQQNKSEQKKLTKYLTLLLEDLDQDKKRLLFCKNADSLKVMNLTQYIDSKELKLSNQTFRDAFKTQTSYIHNATYNSIKSENILELIKNIELQKAMSSYYSGSEHNQKFEILHISSLFANFKNEVIKSKRLMQFYDQMKENSDSINLTKTEDELLYGHFILIREKAIFEVLQYNGLLGANEKLSLLIQEEIK